MCMRVMVGRGSVIRVTIQMYFLTKVSFWMDPGVPTFTCLLYLFTLIAIIFTCLFGLKQPKYFYQASRENSPMSKKILGCNSGFFKHLYFTVPSARLHCSTSKQWRLGLSLCSWLPKKSFSCVSFLWTIVPFYVGGHSEQIWHSGEEITIDYKHCILTLSYGEKTKNKKSMVIRFQLRL